MRRAIYPQLDRLECRTGPSGVFPGPIGLGGLPALVVHAGRLTASAAVGQTFTRTVTVAPIIPGDTLKAVALYEGALIPLAENANGSFTLSHAWNRPAHWIALFMVEDTTYHAIGGAAVTVSVHR
jgi:hypothetical protein